MINFADFHYYYIKNKYIRLAVGLVAFPITLSVVVLLSALAFIADCLVDIPLTIFGGVVCLVLTVVTYCVDNYRMVVLPVFTKDK